MLEFSKQDPLSPARCRKRAMDALARREHSRAELERKLADAGFDGQTVADTLDRLVEERLQCDARFVEAFLASRYRQGKGPVRIRAELSDKGVAPAIVSNALAEAPFDWLARAREVRLSKYGQSFPADFKDKARQMRFLAYRGFSSEHVQAAFRPDDPATA